MLPSQAPYCEKRPLSRLRFSRHSASNSSVAPVPTDRKHGSAGSRLSIQYVANVTMSTTAAVCTSLLASR